MSNSSAPPLSAPAVAERAPALLVAVLGGIVFALLFVCAGVLSWLRRRAAESRSPATREELEAEVAALASRYDAALVAMRVAAASDAEAAAAANGQAGRRSPRDAPCSRFVVDMHAAAFGECTCGWPRGKHSEAALSGLAGLARPPSSGRADLL